MVGSTIPHEVIGVFGGGRILMKPAVEGSGVAAGTSSCRLRISWSS